MERRRIHRRWVTCRRCASIDRPRTAVWVDGRMIRDHNTGTQTTMMCVDCAGTDGRVTRCRGCCPTGHGTRGSLERVG